MKLAASLMLPGDWLLGACGVVLVVGAASVCWGRGAVDRVLIRSDGRPFAELSLHVPQTVAVPGPLGVTEVEIRDGVVRVARDPGPRQLCVRQGWLTRPGQLALCLPNRVSIEVLGGRPRDSLAY